MGLFGFRRKKKEKEEEELLPPLSDIDKSVNTSFPQPMPENINTPQQYMGIQGSIGIESPNTPENPSFNQSIQNIYPQSQFQQKDVYEGWVAFIQSVVNPMLDEKMKDVSLRLEALEEWKEKIETKINTMGKDIKKLEERLDTIYDKLMEKLTDYDSSIKETSAEVKALHRVLQSMIPTIAESVRELKGTIEELKRLREKLP